MHVIVFLVLTLAGHQTILAQNDSLIHSGYHLDKGQALIDSGQYVQAIKQFKYIDPRDTNYILSLSKLADAYLNNGQYDEAIESSSQGLLQSSPYRAQFLNTQGIAYSGKSLFDKATEVFETGQKEYPFRTTFQVQQGKMLYTQGKYAEAEKLFFRALETTPFVSTPHLYLGIISILRGEKVRGMMAMGIYMAINNSANKQLVTLEHFVKNELTDEFTAPPSTPNPFARLDEIIRSEIAMEKEYKTRIPIDAGVVRQYQLLFDQLSTQTFTGNDPWLSFYLPIYKSLAKANLQDAFVYHILNSTSIKQVPEWTSKNQKTLEQFYTTVNTGISQNRIVKNLGESWGYKEPVSCWYDDSNLLEAIGQMNGSKQRTGLWYYYDNNGTRIAQGYYDDKGNKKGVWNYYNNSGVPTSTENFDTGERIYYDVNGAIERRYFVKDQKAEGIFFRYYNGGVIHERTTYHEGLRHGVVEIYSIQGKTVEKFNYDKDSLEGKYLGFFQSGQPRDERTYSRNKLNGSYTNYHRNGKLASQGVYVMGKAEGPWKNYHENGQLKESGMYSNDNAHGEFTFYDPHGQLKEKRNYNNKGEYHGENAFYHDGALHFRVVYRDNIPVESTYFDAAGKVIASHADGKGTFQGKGYYSTGELRSEFQYVEGKAEGSWKYYYRKGALESEYQYSGNKLNGKAIDYYQDHSIKSITPFVDGEAHGFAEAFYPNGKHRYKGWYQNGKRQQQWLSFYASGKLKSDEYFLNDESTGLHSYFDTNGKLLYDVEYQQGLVKMIRHFNDKGELVSTMASSDGGRMAMTARYSSGQQSEGSEFLCGYYHGKSTILFPDGRPFQTKMFANGKLDGAYESYSVDGTRRCVGNYRDGNSTGTWIWYYPDQKVRVKGSYLDDQQDSLWTYYYDNGKLSSEAMFKDDKKHGITKVFSPDGQLVLEKLYDTGDLISYRTPGTQNEKWTPFNGEGTIRANYPGGKIALEESYKNGQLNGARKIYLMDGTVYILENYSKGLSEGMTVYNYPSGKPRIKMPYRMDEADGKWEYYTPDGKIERVENYAEGLLNGIVEFYSNGKKTREVKFRDGQPKD